MRKLLRWTVLGAIATVLSFVALGIFERLVPPKVLRWYQRNIGSRLFSGGAGITPGWALVETTGWRTGRLHRVPVGGRLTGNTYWLLASAGGRAHYVRNIERDAHVRVRVHGRWRDGVAHLCRDDDTRKRLLTLNPLNGIFLWITGQELVTVRIDLEN